MTQVVNRRLRPVIAIDGPAGAGKSTLAAHLAHHFGFLNLESGAMYRALALKAMENATILDDEVALMRLAETTNIILEPRKNQANRVLLDARDVTDRIHETDVSEAASRVSVHPRVRAWMVARQRLLGEAGGVVMEGRDIGTHVFPDAEVKIFLDAADTVRGQRRFLQEAGSEKLSAAARRTQEQIVAAVRDRDARDRTRAASPLERATDAIRLDTSAMSLEEVYRRAEELVESRISRRPSQ